MERNGADAIHIARSGTQYQLYIGEAKTYNRKKGSLQSALSDAVKDLVAKHYARHTDELDLYTYEDFVPPELEAVARRYRSGTLTDIEVHLVCIVTYDQSAPVAGHNRATRIQCVVDNLRNDAAAVKCKTILNGISPDLLPRLNYIIFPVQKMEELIKDFEMELGA